MKRISYLIIFNLWITPLLLSQTYNYDIELKNFMQLDETTFTWDIYLRKGSGSENFALYTMQTRLDFNTAIKNGGDFENTYLTIDASATDLYQPAAWFNSGHVTMVSDGKQFNWATVTNPTTNENVTVIDGTWRKVATFKAQLRKGGNFHNFADLDPQFAFQSTGTQVIVRRCDFTGSNPNAKMSGTSNYEVPRNSVTPALGVPVNTRELAGYCFTGDGDWDATARWNNVTTENANTLPGASNNAIIAGSTTLTDTRTVRQLTVAEGGYLLIGAGEDNLGQLTVSDQLFDDNTVSGGETTIIAGWDFEGSGSTLPYITDEGIDNEASFNTSAAFDAFYDFSGHGIPGGTRAPFATNWRVGPGAGTPRAWIIELETIGYENLKVSSKQWSDPNIWGSGNGPIQFLIQWSLNGTDWNNISGGTVNVANDWTTGVVDDLELHSDLDNQSIIYIRWVSNNSNSNNGYSSIDDIIITGDPLPTGIRMQSTTYGTGSLIHNNAGITATAERYLPGAVSAWHMISAPVGGMEITNSSWHPDLNNPGMHTEDFFMWYEPGIWVNFKNQDGSGGIPSFPVANSSNNFITGRGYLINYYSANPTKEFEGPLNYGGIQVPLEKSNTTPPNWQGVWDEAQAGWNLIGNPYASGLNWNAVVKTDILAEAYAQVYDPNRVGSPGYQVVNDISSGQGFFVLAVADDVTLSLSNTQQIHGGTYLKQETVSAGDMLVLRVSNDEFFDEARIFLNPSSSFDHDFYDASKLFSFHPDVPQIYTQASGGRWLTINSIPSIAEAYHIPVSLKVPSDGLMSITLSEAVGEFSSQTIILHDKFNNTDHNLTEMPTFYFTANACDTLHRFELKFGALGVSELSGRNSLLAYVKDNYLFIMNQGSGVAIIEIFNTSGQLIGHKQIGIGLQHIPVTFPRGAYLLRMISSQEVATGKIVIQ